MILFWLDFVFRTTQETINMSEIKSSERKYVKHYIKLANNKDIEKLASTDFPGYIEKFIITYEHLITQFDPTYQIWKSHDVVRSARKSALVSLDGCKDVMSCHSYFPDIADRCNYLSSLIKQFLELISRL